MRLRRKEDCLLAWDDLYKRDTLELGPGRSLYRPKGSANLHPNIDRNRRVQSLGCGFGSGNMTSAVWGSETEQFPMNDLHQLGCAELFPNNETAVETWLSQSSFHGSTCDVGAADDLFQYYSSPHRLKTAGRETCEIQALQVGSRACLLLHERVVLHMSWDNSSTQPGCQY
jgi:hypothetical protein